MMDVMTRVCVVFHATINEWVYRRRRPAEIGLFLTLPVSNHALGLLCDYVIQNPSVRLFFFFSDAAADAQLSGDLVTCIIFCLYRAIKCKWLGD